MSLPCVVCAVTVVIGHVPNESVASSCVHSHAPACMPCAPWMRQPLVPSYCRWPGRCKRATGVCV
eukprot:1157517-Pelagomonas_calceolata.AAC.2